MMGDNDSTDLRSTNSQKQEQRAHNKCAERGERESEEAQTPGTRETRHREMMRNNAYEIPESSLVIHT